MMPNDLPRFQRERRRDKAESQKRYNGFLDRVMERASQEVHLPEVPISSLPRLKETPIEDLPGVKRH